MVVAYLRSNTGNVGVCEVQKNMILRYAKNHNISGIKFFEDHNRKKRGIVRTRVLHEYGFTKANKWDMTLPGWEDMLLYVLHNPVSVILVDLKTTLHLNLYMYMAFSAICNYRGIRIIEVATVDEPVTTDKKQVAVYHLTNGSEKRPVTCEKAIEKLYDEVSQQDGWDTPYVYLDVSLRKSEHENYNRFKKNASRFDVLLVTDLYHIEDKTGTFIKEVKELAELGVEIISLKEGRLCFTGCDFLRQNLNAAVYDRFAGDHDADLEEAKTALFLRIKSNWSCVSSYIDRNTIERDEKQVALKDMLQVRQSFNVLLVRKFHILNWRTSMFFKIVKQLGVPVYSMAEGGLYLG